MRPFTHWVYSATTEPIYGQHVADWDEGTTFFGQIEETDATLSEDGGKLYQTRTGKITLVNYPPVYAQDYLTDKRHETDWYVVGTYRQDNRLVCNVEAFGTI